MPLFNPKTIKNALGIHDHSPTENELSAAARWAEMARQDFGGQNESQLEAEFNVTVMQGVLGYRPLGPDGLGTIRAKQQIGAGTVDLALGEFTATRASIIAPVELKGPKSGLDSIMPGRAKTPVQQAWEYANDAIGARWVMVSNMRELRLYAVGHGRADYETFDLRQIDNAEVLNRLQLLLHSEQLISGATADLLSRSASEDRDITDALYEDYRKLRDDLLQFVRDQHSSVPADRRIELVQKLLDRLIFIAFAEDSVLVPDDSLRRAIEFDDPYDPKPKWRNLVRLFEAVDKGASKLGIAAYNGGLFATDPDLESLDLPDHLVERFPEISQYDYRSEVSVTILGHIFEQSISDIEALLAEARGEPLPRTGSRKRFGVVYTPEFVTSFIVDQTVGAHLKEISDHLLLSHAKRVDADGNVFWKSKTAEGDYWRAYLDQLTALRIVDPACGSGAFLISAFDLLNAEQKRVRDRLGEIEGGVLAWAHPNADVEIITANLYGVDINAESVEITKLALWLKTAKKGRPLESLELNIQRGNSTIEDCDIDARGFVWRERFRRIFDEGGFDVVVGNPPYVRMELLKLVKRYLETRYSVVSDRADLYAYFFELGLRLLKPGGRLGYISSSTFFRTRSGAPLRQYLSQNAHIEAIIDFGDLQVFEGVTTYPSILILKKVGEASSNTASSDRSLAVRFLNLKEFPPDLAAAFEERAQQMPQSRLGVGSWRFESDALNSIRNKMAASHRTLGELLGPPLCGVKTGLNDAFVVSRELRDRLIARDSRSDELLKPFLIGENLQRWHFESDDLWLIYTPKSRVDIEDYPAVRDHLAQFRDRLQARATQQNWWELQQAQLAYVPAFEAKKVIWPEFSQGPKFSFDASGSYPLNKVYFVSQETPELVAVLGSKPVWFYLFGDAGALRGGKWRLITGEAALSRVPIPEIVDRHALALLATEIQSASEELAALVKQTLHRLADIAPSIETMASFRTWPNQDFTQLRLAIVKRLRTDFPISERDEWERWYENKRLEATAMRQHIANAEAEISQRAYSMFALTTDEIALIEEALEGQY
ncbi:MAG: Eco57I restriction-modification methylase domain-containing protein [Sphingomonas sp.]